MSGFGKKQEKKSKTKVINEDEYDKLVKKYKRIKKFMNSPLHEIKRISGEKTINTKEKQITSKGNLKGNN